MKKRHHTSSTKIRLERRRAAELEATAGCWVMEINTLCVEKQRPPNAAVEAVADDRRGQAVGVSAVDAQLMRAAGFRE